MICISRWLLYFRKKEIRRMEPSGEEPSARRISTFRDLKSWIRTNWFLRTAYSTTSWKRGPTTRLNRSF